MVARRDRGVRAVAADALRGDDENTLFQPSEVELAETTKRWSICASAQAAAARVRFAFGDAAARPSPLRYRRQILALKQYFAGRGCTVLLLDDRTGTQADVQLQSLAHGVMTLEQLVPALRRASPRMRVAKLRGVDFRGGYHDYVIETGGIMVFPRLVAAEHTHEFERGVPRAGWRSSTRCWAAASITARAR